MGRLKDRLFENIQAQQKEYEERMMQEQQRQQQEEYTPQLSEGYNVDENYRHQVTPQEKSMEDVAREQAEKEKSPLAVLEEIKNKPSPRGTYATIIGGRPIDLHMLEDYVLKLSPYSLKTILRYNNARMIEEIKNYSKLGGAVKFNTKILIAILLAVGMAVVGVIMLMYGPQMIEGMKNMF